MTGQELLNGFSNNKLQRKPFKCLDFVVNIILPSLLHEKIAFTGNFISYVAIFHFQGLEN